MKEKFEIREFFNVSPSLIYHAWLDSNAHTEMTGGEAECSTIVDEDFSAWDGYIWGKNVQLVNNQEIVQTWRTTEFMQEDEDSMVTILLKEVEYQAVLDVQNNLNARPRKKLGFLTPSELFLHHRVALVT